MLWCNVLQPVISNLTELQVITEVSKYYLKCLPKTEVLTGLAGI